jgi:DNA-binding protein H-NS
MAIDISGLTIPELTQLAADARARIEHLKKQQFAEVRRSLEAQAREAGYDIYELFAGRSVRSAMKPSDDQVKRYVAPKYRNPINHLQTWTGRGKQPHWVRDAIAAGKSLDDLLIAN